VKFALRDGSHASKTTLVVGELKLPQTGLPDGSAPAHPRSGSALMPG
jgi:hypothetical protein